MALKRLRNYEKLIKKATGHNYKVFVVNWIHGGYGAICYNGKKFIKVSKDQVGFLPLFWHEMGHIVMDRDGQTFFEAEYNAQAWALNDLLQRKQKVLYKQSINWIRTRWGKTGTASDELYSLVRAKILRRFSRIHK